MTDSNEVMPLERIKELGRRLERETLSPSRRRDLAADIRIEATKLPSPTATDVLTDWMQMVERRLDRLDRRLDRLESPDQ